MAPHLHTRSLPLYAIVMTWQERPLLLISSVVAKLMPVAAALAHSLSPLSYAATFIPFLPSALHPDPNTLVNFSPMPFLIGVEVCLTAPLEITAPRSKSGPPWQQRVLLC